MEGKKSLKYKRKSSNVHSTVTLLGTPAQLLVYIEISHQPITRQELAVDIHISSKQLGEVQAEHQYDETKVAWLVLPNGLV